MNKLNLFRFLLVFFTAIASIMLVLIGVPIPIQAQSLQCEDRLDKATSPAEIWMEINTFFAIDWGRPQPFAPATPFTSDEYIAGVLLGELGPNVDSVTDANLPSDDGLWKDTALEALAVAVRSFTWFRLNYASQFPDPADPHFITRDGLNKCGFYDTGAQTFRPHYQGVSQAIKDHYTEIVTQYVPNIYLVEGNGTKQPIDAEYRATVGPNSDSGGKSYLISIFDPISAEDNPSYSHPGMGQWGAQRWAMGLNDAGDSFPRWQSYQQILFHYYTGVHLRTIGGNILTPIYRWNPLVVTWSDTGSFTPPTMFPGGSYNVTLHLQNCGKAAWGSDVKLVYYWRHNGVRITNPTLVDVANLVEGDDDTVTFKVNCNLGGSPPAGQVSVERSTTIEGPVQLPAPVKKPAGLRVEP